MTRYENPHTWVAHTIDQGFQSLAWDWTDWLRLKPGTGFWGSVDVALRLGEVEGELVATGILLTNGDGPITREDLRSFPLQAFLNRAAELEVRRVLEPRPVKGDRRLGGSHPGRAGYEHKDFERFAADYSRALRMLGTKNKALEALAVPYKRHASTLYRWVDRCQELGLLDTEDDQ